MSLLPTPAVGVPILVLCEEWRVGEPPSRFRLVPARVTWEAPAQPAVTPAEADTPIVSRKAALEPWEPKLTPPAPVP